MRPALFVVLCFIVGCCGGKQDTHFTQAQCAIARGEVLQESRCATVFDPAWEARYAKVRAMLAKEVEANRHRKYYGDGSQLGAEIERLNDETIPNEDKPFFWDENHRIWNLVECGFVLLHEQTDWITQELAGSKFRGLLPMTDEMQNCIDNGAPNGG